MNIMDNHWLRLAVGTAVTGCLLATGSLQASASIIPVNPDTGETELLAKAASPTLDTESVLRDLASGRYRAVHDSVVRKRGPWRKVGRTMGRIARYGPLAGVVSPKKNMKASTKVLIGMGITAATVVALYAIAVDRAADAVENIARDTLRTIRP